MIQAKHEDNLMSYPSNKATGLQINDVFLSRDFYLKIEKSISLKLVLIALVVLASNSDTQGQDQSPISYERTRNSPVWTGDEFIKDQSLSLIYTDSQIEVYSDERLTDSVAWPFDKIKIIWKYAKEVYLKSTGGEKLIIVAHNKKNKGCYLTLTATDVNLNRIVMDLNFRDWKQDVVSHLCIGLGVMLTDKNNTAKPAKISYRSHSTKRFISNDLMNSLGKNGPSGT